MKKYTDINYAGEELFTVEENNTFFGIMDSKGKEIVPCKYNDLFNFHNGVSIINKDYYYGLIDKSGKSLISIKYEELFSSDYKIFTAKKDSKYGFIDKNDNIIIPFKYNDALAFNDGIAAVNLNGKWGYINIEGKEIIPFKYDECDYFKNDLAVVRKNYNCGLINTRGKEIVPCKYNDIGNDFIDGITYVMNNDLKFGFINEQGKEIIPCLFDDCYYKPSDRFVAVKKNDKWGFIGLNDNKTIFPKYRSVSHFSNGIAVVRKFNGKQAYINTQGKEISNIQFDVCNEFSDGIGTAIIDNKAVLINSEGNIKETKYNMIGFFSDGIAICKNDSEYYGLIDKQGKEIVPCKYKNIFIPEEESFKLTGLVKICNEGDKEGFIDKIGRVIIPPKYDFIYYILNYKNMYLIGNNNTCGILDNRKGELKEIIYK